MKRGTPKIGDIIQIRTGSGYAYAQLTHRNKLLGFLVRVLPGIHPDPVRDYNQVVNVKELYYTFLFREDLNEVPRTETVGNAPVLESCKQFPLFRDGVANPETRRVAVWWLWDGEKEWPIGKLNDEQNTLPLRHIWTSVLLVKRIEAGWLPMYEV